MFTTLKKLYKVNLITPRGLYSLLGSLFSSGISLASILRYAAKIHPKSPAISDEYGTLIYTELLSRTKQLALVFQEQYNITSQKKVALFCRNHTSLVISLFAASQLGADVFLLNTEMGQGQFNSLVNRHDFDLIIYDEYISDIINASNYKGGKVLAHSATQTSITRLSIINSANTSKIKKGSFGKIIVLTGGTTGNAKIAERKPSVFNFLNPFFALLVKLNLDSYKSVYIATPIYHGFGIASLFISLLLGSHIRLLQKFEVEKASKLIHKEKIEVVTLVPLMLFRMLHYNSDELKSLQCIISGGAPLNPTLVQETFNKLGNKLSNLYGTSEAGFSVMATSTDLKYSAETIGKGIQGVTLIILDVLNKEVAEGIVGRLCIKSKWAVNNSNWVETGDLGYKDAFGYYFLKGRVDDMIISGGENVYPIDLENILIQHDEILQAAVIGIEDIEFGQRLKAFVVLTKNSGMLKDHITKWLSTKIARYQMPKEIDFLNEIPYTSLGKPDKKALLLI